MIIFLGIVLVILGIAFFYWPNKIVKFLDWVEKNLFNKRSFILQSKKIGLVLVLIGVILVFTNVRVLTKKNLLYKAHTNFYTHDFASTERICLEIINKQPNNIDAWLLLGKTYFVTGRYLLAKSVFVKIKNMADINEKKKKEIEKYIILIDKKLEKQK
jgi:tetratricopeptide (TPR) repeat protein